MILELRELINWSYLTFKITLSDGHKSHSPFTDEK